MPLSSAGLSYEALGQGLFTPVANRTSFSQSNTPVSNGTDTSTTYRTHHTVIQTCNPIQFVYHNSFNNAGSEADGANNITVRAGVEAPAGTRNPVFFNGARSVVIEPGAYVVSDPFGFPFNKGDTILATTNVSVTAGQTWRLPITNTLSALSEGNNANGGDATVSGSIPNTSGVDMYGPAMILGIPKVPGTSVIGIIGDSIIAAITDLNQTSPQPLPGYFLRGLNNNYPFVNLSMSGDSYGNWNQTSPSLRHRRLPLLRFCTHLVVALGTNDSTSMSTRAKIFWNTLAQFGLPFYVCTIPPNTTSSDSWATTTGQTVVSNESTRLAYNALVRSAPSPMAGMFELADQFETARDSGFWKSVATGAAAAYTTDGKHPSTQAHTDAAAVVFTSKVLTGVFGDVAR